MVISQASFVKWDYLG